MTQQPTVCLLGLEPCEGNYVRVRFLLLPSEIEVPVNVSGVLHSQGEYHAVRTAWIRLGELLAGWHTDALRQSNDHRGDDLRDRPQFR